MVVWRNKLRKVLAERGITQNQLRDMCHVRQSYISDIANNNTTTFNRENFAKIMEALNITDMNEMFEMVDVTETPRS